LVVALSLRTNHSEGLKPLIQQGNNKRASLHSPQQRPRLASWPDTFSTQPHCPCLYIEEVAEQAHEIAHKEWKPEEGYSGHLAGVSRVTGWLLKQLIDESVFDLSDQEEQATFELTSEGPKRTR
jgi:hypothetical protein